MRLDTRPRAKVNLGLAVTGRRVDGYHELSSVFLRVGLSDRLGVRLGEPSLDEDRLHVSGADDLPVADNLVLRAVRLLRAEVDPSLPPLELELEKRVPLAAGLGGGSSDAAAALGLAAAIWELDPSPDRQGALALALGADVPFFLGDDAAALVEGIGERLEPLPGVRGGAGLLVVTPSLRLSTPEAFGAYDRLDRPASGAAERVAGLAQAMRRGLDGPDLAAWSDRLAAANDLWPAALALEPDLAGVRSGLEASLGQRVLMTGSGASLVGLYASADDAVVAGRGLVAALPDSLAGATISACDTIGPDPHWRYP